MMQAPSLLSHACTADVTAKSKPAGDMLINLVSAKNAPIALFSFHISSVLLFSHFQKLFKTRFMETNKKQ